MLVLKQSCYIRVNRNLQSSVSSINPVFLIFLLSPGFNNFINLFMPTVKRKAKSERLRNTQKYSEINGQIKTKYVTFISVTSVKPPSAESFVSSYSKRYLFWHIE